MRMVITCHQNFWNDHKGINEAERLGNTTADIGNGIHDLVMGNRRLSIREIANTVL